MILQIHDELILEALDEEAAKAEALLREEMESVAQLKVPLRVPAWVTISCGTLTAAGCWSMSSMYPAVRAGIPWRISTPSAPS